MLPGMFLVNMVRKKRIKPEQDAKEHILSDKDKAFIKGRQINTFKGRGVFALEHIESSTFVVEYRGILSQSKHVEDVEGNYLFDFTWNGTRYCIDATKVDGSLGRLLNDDHRNPNCKVKTIIVDGRPHLCLFSIRDIFPDEEVTYNYGDSLWPWCLRLQELCDETSVTVTECSVNPSSSVNEKMTCKDKSKTVVKKGDSALTGDEMLQELCDETSVTVTECSVNPSSSVNEKMTCKDKSKTVAKKGDSALTGDEMELCDETSVTVTECSVNPSSSVNEKCWSVQEWSC
ncbi:histone-lysine N-methyltransferase, H3 lysine-36 specific-like isoform X3 [Megalobrama amblycephala]|uniref:histone-lysine N-methyltransferase, H3 lysine-36 specific-like isoform X3 n=1 Tax=Megalobrama amblycephala TaxID=75352 RepID=UPI002013CF45|nr:histone-lysine N-methyltransferase, H3 lysine-36 specific-like isoform X3 [Megalobrama amblycephala]